MSTAVSIQEVTKRFGRVVALDRVSFDVPRGSLFGLLGPNGAGKTTLFSLAAGFLHPNAGRIEVLGIDVRQIGRLRGRFSMHPQDASFQGGVPVFDQLVMFCRLAGLGIEDARREAREALGLVGLERVTERTARALSHGMMKRVVLCQAFLGDPEVVFLDEPTSGLDPENARRMRELIRSFRQKRTVIISSHNLHEIQDLCDHVAILDEGHLVEAGSMEELTQSGNLVRVTLADSLPPEAEKTLLALPCVEALERTSGVEFNVTLDLSATPRTEAMKALYDALASHSLYPRSVQEGASLEVRFLEITGGRYDGASST